jgi:O-antigen/teichoic acid export membrane protein
VKMERFATRYVLAITDRLTNADGAEGRQESRAIEPIGRVARGGVAALFTYGAGIGLTYCSQLFIARITGVDTYGIYAYVFSWMVVLAYFSTLGFDVALLRFVPAYQVDRAWSLLRGVIQYAQGRAAVVGITVAVLGALAVVAGNATPVMRNTFIVGFGLVPILALVRIRCSVVRALGGVFASLAPDRIVRDGLLVAFLGIAAVSGLSWTITAPWVMSMTLISSAIGLGLTVFAMREWHPAAINSVSSVYDSAAWRRSAIPLLIAGATEVLMNRTGVILLGWFADTKEAGIYSLVFNIALVVTVPRVAVNTLFAPAISDLNARNDRATMQVLVTRAASWTLCAGLCVALVLFVAAEPILAWFGSGFQAGVPALRILLISQAIAAGAGSQLYVMTMTGHERSAALLLMSVAIINLIASVALIQWFGLIGAAGSTAVALIVWNGAMALFLWRRLRLSPGVLGIFRPQFGGKR